MERRAFIWPARYCEWNISMCDLWIGDPSRDFGCKKLFTQNFWVESSSRSSIGRVQHVAKVRASERFSFRVQAKVKNICEPVVLDRWTSRGWPMFLHLFLCCSSSLLLCCFLCCFLCVGSTAIPAAAPRCDRDGSLTCVRITVEIRLCNYMVALQQQEDLF